MRELFRDSTYRAVYLGQVLSILGTGLATVALGLLAYEFSGEAAGAVLGLAMAIRMAANMGVSTIASGFVSRFSRRKTLVAMDIVRASVAMLLPFITEVWQIFVLIFVLQSASAVASPVIQAAIPDIFPDERRYTKALTMTRLAYDVESVASPVIAGLLLYFMTFHNLFFGTAAGFLASATLISVSGLKSNSVARGGEALARIRAGFAIYYRTPRLLGVLAISFCAAAAISMVVANTVVIVQNNLGLDSQATALALASFGFGSITAAIVLPRLLLALGDRTIMLSGGVLILLSFGAGYFVSEYWQLHLAWICAGLGFASIQTPIGRVVNRSCHRSDRNEAFAAQFALSHACRLITYLVCGFVGAEYGIGAAFIALGAICIASMTVAALVWPRHDDEVLFHRHTGLDPDDPHWQDGDQPSDGGHTHVFVIDDLHRRWPQRG